VNRIKKIKPKVVLFHLLFWTGVWFFYFYFFSYNSNDTAYITWFSSCLLPVTMMVTYFVVYFLIPRYLLTKKYVKLALYSFYTFVFSAYIVVLVIYGCLIFLLRFNISMMPPMSKNFLFILLLVYLVAGVVSFITILNHNFKTASVNKELQNKILATQLQLKEQELHYLKRQIHPHFLFNTLNTIYGFAIRQSKQTPEIILKLSNLLDYILYQVNKPKVSMKEEVLHIKEYIELEKIRFQETLKVEFTANEIDENIQVAPMLLIPFVENAFKHGTLEEGFLTIRIQISVTDNRLSFRIGNSYRESNDKSQNGGIGLENIRKRLDLNYRNNYELKIDIRDNWYFAKLTIFNLNKPKDAENNS
jgi:two-component system, LytTR family, sensor kinase